MPALNVRLFGQLSISYGDRSVEDLIPGKAKELFCYLLTHRRRPVTRESLATLLWEDSTLEHSKQYLRKALWQLQQGLSMAPESAGVVLQADGQRIAINAEADLWLDIEEFERTCAMVYSRTWQTKSNPGALQAALDLYRGDLLEGCYKDWCLWERERLQNIYLVVLDKFVSCCESQGEYATGQHYAQRILHCDRAHEAAHQHLMRLLYLAGDRAGALRQFERCAAALKEELGVQPSSCTHQLYQQISEDHLLAKAVPDSNSPASKEDRDLLHSAFGRLQEMKAAVNMLQSAVEDALAKVGRALHPSIHSTASSKNTRR